MFTGLIEEVGIVKDIQKVQDNLTFTIQAKCTPELHVDESIAHNGICLTVEKILEDNYQVTAVKETIEKTTIAQWQKGDKINLERAMQIGDRLGGHIVQGHIDDTAELQTIQDNNGSTNYTFTHNEANNALVIDKGSITINGTSLTLFDVGDRTFTVTIIPYTMEHTNFQFLKTGDRVNIEYDILGKYFQRNATLFFNQYK